MTREPYELIDDRATVTVWLEQLRADGVRGELALVEMPDGKVRARVTPPGTVTTRRPDPGLARPAPRRSLAQRMPVWSRWVVVAAAVGAVFGAVGWVAYEVWTYRYVILGLAVVALVTGVATRGGRKAVIGLFEGGTVRWFDER